MSRPNSPFDLFPHPDPDREFGKDEGLTGYALLAWENRDSPIENLAERAVRLQMIIGERFDVNPRKATQAVVDELRIGLPEMDTREDDG